MSGRRLCLLVGLGRLEIGSLAPVYREEGIQDWEGLNKSERDLDFVNETMRTDQIQSIITRIEMVAQDLIQTASGDDAQRLKRSM